MNNELLTRIKYGDIDGVEMILLMSEEINSSEQNDYSYALPVAALFNQPEIVKLLLEFGANVNTTLGDLNMDYYDYFDCYGYNSLHIATLRSYSEIVKILLEYEANIYTKMDTPDDECSSMNSLMIASKYANKEIVKEILKFKPGIYKNGNKEYLFSFIDDVKQKNKKTQTDDSETDDSDDESLNPYELIKILCDDGQLYSVFLDLEDASGYTAFSHAILNSNFEIATLLADYGANINVYINYTGTPFFEAITYDNSDIIEWFTNRADFTVKEDEKNEALLILATYGNIQFIKWIIYSQGADMNYVNDQDTSLHLAAYFDRLDTCLFLISIGMDPNLQNNHNLSPLIDYGKGIDTNCPNRLYNETRIPLSKEEKQARKEQLIEARANYLELQQREDRWQRRKNALMTKTDFISEKKINFDTFCQIVKYL
uniref:Uncharacterized protein n=1 Tax=viral metagenome TaxID=1070528 RepID=A0A6C0DAD6_9ZZZZ